MACPSALAPLGTALSDFAGRNGPGRLTNSAARTDVALLIRRAVRPTKGAHPLRNPRSRVQLPQQVCANQENGGADGI